jgi:hypothetical protein
MTIKEVEDTVAASGKMILISASEISDLPDFPHGEPYPYYQITKTETGFSWKGMDEPLLPGEKHVGEPA